MSHHLYKFSATLFRDVSATTKREQSLTLQDMADLARNTSAGSKAELPLWKLALFGDKRTNKGSLRHNANVLSVTGIEFDYDAERMSFDDAADILHAHRIMGIIYTSPSHTEDTPRWRVMCPLADPVAPDRRDYLLSRLNGAFGGIIVGESWTLSQSYYYGTINSNPSHRMELAGWHCIDQLGDLDAIRISKPEQAKPQIAYTVVATKPLRGRDLERIVIGSLDRVRSAPEGQRHCAVRNEARLLGGIQHAARFSDDTASGWLLAALPAPDRDISAARAIEWGLSIGRSFPIETGLRR